MRFAESSYRVIVSVIFSSLITDSSFHGLFHARIRAIIGA